MLISRETQGNNAFAARLGLAETDRFCSTLFTAGEIERGIAAVDSRCMRDCRRCRLRWPKEVSSRDIDANTLTSWCFRREGLNAVNSVPRGPTIPKTVIQTPHREHCKVKHQTTVEGTTWSFSIVHIANNYHGNPNSSSLGLSMNIYDVMRYKMHRTMLRHCFLLRSMAASLQDTTASHSCSTISHSTAPNETGSWDRKVLQ